MGWVSTNFQAKALVDDPHNDIRANDTLEVIAVRDDGWVLAARGGNECVALRSKDLDLGIDTNISTAGSQNARTVLTTATRTEALFKSRLQAAVFSSDRAAAVATLNRASQIRGFKYQLDPSTQAPASDNDAASRSNPLGPSASTEQLISSVSGAIMQACEGRRNRIVPSTSSFDIDGSPLSLLIARHESAERKARSRAAPASASSSLALAVSQGLHGGPGVPSEQAGDLSGLPFPTLGDSTHSITGQSSGQATLFAAIQPSPPVLSSSSVMGEGAGLRSHGTVQILLDVDVSRALRDFGQPADLFVSVFDAQSQTFVTDEARVFVDERGIPAPAPMAQGSTAGFAISDQHGLTDGTLPVGHAQALFLSVPRALVTSGRAYLVFRLYRLGPLKESAAVKAMKAAAQGTKSKQQGGAVAASGGSIKSEPSSAPARDGASGQLSRSLQTASEAAAGLDSQSSDEDDVGDELDSDGNGEGTFFGGKAREGASAAASTSTSTLSGAKAAAREALSSGLRFLLRRKRKDTAIYSRMVGVGVSAIPAIFPSLADGTPHKPAHALHFVRPQGKLEEPRFFSLHRQLIADLERDAEQAARRSTAGSGGAADTRPIVSLAQPNTSGTSSVESSVQTEVSVSAPAANGVIVRTPRMHSLAIVARCFGGLHMPVVSDARFRQLLGPQTAEGLAVEPCAWSWMQSHTSVLGGLGPGPFQPDPHPPFSRQPSWSPAAFDQGPDGGVAPRSRVTHPVILAAPALRGFPLLDSASPLGGGRSASAVGPPNPLPLSRAQRNDLYVTIGRGVFNQDAKIAPRNVQVRVSVVTDRGEVLPVLHRGSPTDHAQNAFLPEQASGGLLEYRSAVYYHCNAPAYEERVCVRIPSSSQFAASHLLFSFWHASSQETRTHAFAFAVLPLAATDGTPLRDGRHSLRVFRAVEGLEAGLANPWYLVAPLVDGSGQEVLGPAPVPFDAYLARPAVPSASLPPADSAAPASPALSSSAAGPTSRLRSLSSFTLGRSFSSSSHGGGASDAIATAADAAIASSQATGSPRLQPAAVSYSSPSIDADGYPVLTAAHAASARMRHIPMTAQPAPLRGPSDAAPLVPTPLPGLGEVSNKPASQVRRAGLDSARGVSSLGPLAEEGALEGSDSDEEEALLAPDPSQQSQSLVSASFVAGTAGASAGKPAGNQAKSGFETGQSAWPAVEIRGKDFFEIETCFISDVDSSVPELHCLAYWETQPRESLLNSLTHLPKLCGDPQLAMRSMPLLLSSLTDLIAAQPPPALREPSISGVHAQRNSGGERTSEQGQHKLLAAALRALVAFTDRFYSPVRPAHRTQGPSAPGGQADRAGTRNALASSFSSVGSGGDSARRPTGLGSVSSGLGFPHDGRRASNASLRSFSFVDGPGALPPQGSDDTVVTDSAWLQKPEWPPASPAQILPRMASRSVPGFDGLRVWGAWVSSGPSCPRLHAVLLPSILHALESACEAKPDDAHSAGLAPTAAAGWSSGAGRLVLQPRAILHILRSLPLLARICVVSRGQPQSSLGSEGAFTGHVRRLCASLLTLLSRPLEQCPPWLLSAKCAVLRLLPATCAELAPVLPRGELCRVLTAGIAAVPQRHWATTGSSVAASLPVPSSPLQSGVSIPGVPADSLGLCQLLASLECFHAGFASGKCEAARGLRAAMLRTAQAHMNSAGAQRVLSVQLAASLIPIAASDEAAPSVDRPAASMLSELARATCDLLCGRPAPGDVVKRRLAMEAAFDASDDDEAGHSEGASPPAPPAHWVSPESAAIQRAFVDAGLPVPMVGARSGEATSSGAARLSRRVPIPSHILAALGPAVAIAARKRAALRELEADCSALPRSAWLAVYGPASTSGPSSSPQSGGGGPTHVRTQAQIAAAALIHVINSLPDAVAPYLLATLLPVRPNMDPQAFAAGGLATSDVDGSLTASRLALVLQLLRTSLTLLACDPFPSAWVELSQAALTSAVRVYRWAGGYLAACHGGAGDSGPSVGEESWRIALTAWSSWCELGLALLTSPVLTPEAQPAGQRAAWLQQWGDRRVAVCSVFRQVWGGALSSGESSTSGSLATASPPDLASVPVIPAAAFRDASGAAMIAWASSVAGTPVRPVLPALCPALRLALAPLLVGPALDLTHSGELHVSSLARDLFMDLMRAELAVRYGSDSTEGAGVAYPRAGLRGLEAGLPTVERYTIDAIDEIVSRGGPSLVSVPTRRSTSASLGSAYDITPRPALLRSSSSSQSLEGLGEPGLRARGLASSPVKSTASFAHRSVHREGSASYQQLLDPLQGSVGPGQSCSPPANNLLMRLLAPLESTLSGPGPSSALAGNGGNASLLRHPVVATFLAEIRTLYAMLSALGRFPRTPAFEDERAAAAETLISYLQRSHRSDLYSRHVCALRDMHATLGNAAEAAMSGLLHADALDWSDTPLQPSLASGGQLLFPAQTSAQRLEQVLSSSAAALADAGCWEEAARLHQLLAARYELVTADYAKLASALRASASLFEDIRTKPRMFPSYFVVCLNDSAAWAAGGLPARLPVSADAAAGSDAVVAPGAVMVCRGSLGERISEFEARLASKWSPARKEPMRQFGPGGATQAPSTAAAYSFTSVTVVPAVPVHPLYAPQPVTDDGYSGPAADSDGSRSDHPLHLAEPIGSPGRGKAPPAPRGSRGSVPAVSTPRPSGGEVLLATPKTPARRADAILLSPGRATNTQTPVGAALHAPATVASVNPLVDHLGIAAAARALPAQGGSVCPAALPVASSRLPPLIRQGRSNAGARVFMLQRPYRVRAAKSGNEFLDTWVSRTYFVTADAFPATHRRSPVVSLRTVTLNPLEAASLALREKNCDLLDALERVQGVPDRGGDQAFTSLLQGVVDAAVSGGVANYRPFLTGEFTASHPEIAHDLEACEFDAGAPKGGQREPRALALLRAALAEQLTLLQRGVALHGTKCARDMLPLHAFLVERFAALCERLGSLGVVLPGPGLDQSISFHAHLGKLTI